MSEQEALLNTLLAGRSDGFKAKVLEIVYRHHLDPNDPNLQILIATGQLEVLLQDAPEQFESLFARLLETLRRLVDSEHSALKQQMQGIRQLQDEQQQTFAVKLQALQKVLDQLEKQQAEHDRQQEIILQEYKTALADLTTQKPEDIWTSKRLLLAAISATFLTSIGGFGGWSAKTAQIYQHYSPAELEYLSKLWQWNSDRLLKCQTTQNPKCTIWIVPPPSK
jgi:uncharacterized protein (UPF0335 family)